MSELSDDLLLMLMKEAYCRDNGECTKDNCNECEDYAVSYNDIQKILKEN